MNIAVYSLDNRDFIFDSITDAIEESVRVDPPKTQYVAVFIGYHHPDWDGVNPDGVTRMKQLSVKVKINQDLRLIDYEVL